MSEASELPQLNVEYSKRIKNEYLELYKEMVDQLSTNHFDDVVQVFKEENLTFNADSVAKVFKENLLADFIQSFETSWLTCNIGENIGILEELKKRNLHKKTGCWRPSGQSVEEQTIHVRIKLLEMKKKFLEKQYEFQKIKLQEVIATNEGNRKLINDLSNERNKLSEEMERRKIESSHTKEKLKALVERIL